MDVARLKEKLERVKDPRRQWRNIRHKLEEILVIGLVTVVCNGENFEYMEVFGREREAERRKFLELPGGIPDASTFSRIFKRVNPVKLLQHLYEWFTEARDRMCWGGGGTRTVPAAGCFRGYFDALALIRAALPGSR